MKAQHLTAELISDAGTIAPGGRSRVALALTLEPGWHVYWVYAGDSGEPPQVQWSVPSGFSIGPMQYPAPSRLPLGPLMDYGYEGTAVFPFNVSTSPQAPLGNADLKAHVRWLVCREVCVPGKAYLGLNLNVIPQASSETNKLIDAAVGAEPVKVPTAVKIGVTATRDTLMLNVVTGKKEISAEYYPLDDDSIRNAADQKIEPIADGIRLVTERADISDMLPKELKGVLKLSDGRSYMLDVPVGSATAHSGAGDERGLLLAVVLAFAGGIILNLMPCVFPVLFLKALALVGRAGESRTRQRAHGMAYTAGILCSFWLIVGALLTLRALGKQAGWGFQLQSPGFVVAMTCLLFFMALSLAGMFDLGLTWTSAGDDLARKGGYFGSFFTGVLATVVATPCTAPLMGAAIGFALSQNALVTFAVFTSLAFGLALPYFALTFVPGWASKLPRPGRWMETLKQFTSVPLFLTVVWLIWIYGRLSGSTTGDSTDHVARLLVGLLILAIGGWILGRWPARRWGYIAVAVTAAAALAFPLVTAQPDRLRWSPFSNAALEEAQSQGKPVFVDFTAAWCLSCQVNEKAVLQDRVVEQELLRRHYVLLRADWTRYDPEITSELSRVGRSGVPTYVIISGPWERATHVLPELLTRGVVLDAIRQAGIQQNSQMPAPLPGGKTGS
ncbi:protein-disulfide reductase DsbD family protein [Alloacidobacterium dinghuense]|uniref:protein-disulfide reductase DsbD family protein n=1 Tax=Alloacidobacterium dinghuense TaxID=2763107 RepID=UPI002036A7A9|nr:thioredoxin family protein [Alloacidobacterium dinghuense]